MTDFKDFPNWQLLQIFGASFHCDVTDGNLLPMLSDETLELRDEILKRMGEGKEEE